MCTNAAKTAYAVLSGIEPTLKTLLTIEGVAGSAQAVAAMTAYDQALADLKNWTPGTASQETIEVLADLQLAIQALPIPESYQLLVNTVLAGVITVIGLVTGNSPAPAASLPDGVTAEEAQADHERATMAVYSARAQSLVPFYKFKTRATWAPGREPAEQYKGCWNKAVDLTAGAPASWKV